MRRLRAFNAYMIDRETVAKIADHAIGAYIGSDLIDVEAARSEAILEAVDEFTQAEPSHDDIEAEIERIKAQYLALNARPALTHWMWQTWASERIAARRAVEDNSR